MNNTFVKSTLILSVATLLSKVLGSIFRIPLQNIAGDEVLGIFSLVYPVYMVALILSVAGIPIAISKLISEANVNRDTEKIRNIYVSAVILALLFGLASFTLVFSFSAQIAEALGGQSTRLALIVVSGTLLVAPYMAVYRGYFQGFQDMKPTAISQVLEQFIRVGIILISAYILVQQNRSDEVVAGGIMVGSIIGALLSTVYLRWLFQKSALKPVEKNPYTFGDFKKTGKEILYISLPIVIGSVTMALLNFVDSFTVPSSLQRAGVPQENINYQYGIYGRGLSLVQIATVFSSSIILPLIPLMTKMLTEGKKAEAKGVIERTHSLTHLISWPAAIGLFALTLPVNLALFTDLEGSWVLAVIGLSSVFTSLTILGTGVLQGMDLARLGAYIIIGGVVLKVITNIALISVFGLPGAAYSTLIVYLAIFIANSIYIYRKIPFKVWGWKTTSMVISAVVMGAVIGLPTLYWNIGEWSRLTALVYVMAAIGTGAIIYFILLLATRGITKAELLNLPVVSKLFKKRTGGAETGSGAPGTEKQRPSKGWKNLKKALWGLLILSLILATPGIAQRFQAEWKNNAYEMVLPYGDIETMAEDGLTTEEILTRLKQSGLQAVSIEPETLKSLEDKGYVTTITSERMREVSLFEEDVEGMAERNLHDGLYIYFQRDAGIRDELSSIFADADIEEITFRGKELLFIPGNVKKIENMPLSFLTDKAEEVKGAGLSLVLRIQNVKQEDNPFLFDQMLELADEEADRVLFLGTEVSGAPDAPKIKEYAERLKEANMSVYTIEFADQKGFYTLANSLDMDVIRLHSLNLNTIENESVGVERAIRAVKERNIRSIFLRAEDKDGKEALESLENFIETVHNDMPTVFHAGKAEVFEDINVPVWSYIFAFASAILFISLAALEVFKNRILFILAFLGMLALSLGYAVLGKTLILQGIALIVAIVTPVYALLPLRDIKSFKDILISYGRAILISASGIMIIVALLNGTEYLIKVEAFRGVKLIYIFPIFFMFMFAMWILIKGEILTNIKRFLNMAVQYWHVAAIGVIGIIGLYYITRTGNQGSVSELELAFRSWLEQLMYVRPRTKEFLIGFPFYILALYVIGINKKWGVFLLIPGVIGFLSIMNTFTHLHIPLYVSILRTAYSLIIGLIIGWVLVLIAKKVHAIFNERVKPRWFS
ncbi:O-antigen/teichoic acid export membrane protein [Cytobacillus oceanisediminis]|uniref:O-antigen/teichoic acid export membrane protein n=1 Tax=Cytobacillus oceanisediminis TaxID=665099 RepID=A0A2V3A3F7_9BACI|nr:DUF5693 family protein [Cytobacillus oceanisediminis]PWW31251.1 O-antigen/teichoic acid export membrane protein [Cytobacillus oceanisediminis]